MTNLIKHQIQIPDELKGKRLDFALAQLLPDYSRVLIQKWIKIGHVTINDKEIKAKQKVMGGEIVHIETVLEQQVISKGEAIPLNIIYEDEDLLVINKPPGLTVHPGHGNPNKTLLNAILYHLPELNILPRAGIIHRLDKDTSGLLVIAKNIKSYTWLTKQLKLRLVKRQYQAVVYGKIISGGTIEQPVGRHPIQRKMMAVTESGKPAITHYRVLEKYTHHTRIQVQLETGRTHQIRVHMAYIQHPLIGDPLYAGRLRIPKAASPELIDTLKYFKRQALHAELLAFKHPSTKKLMEWKIDLPEDIQRLCSVLKKNTA